MPCRFFVAPRTKSLDVCGILAALRTSLRGEYFSMAQVANWYQRKFDFSFPVELYPDLCVRLRGAPARLEELVRGCAAGRMVGAAEGKWSAQEHAGHLLELEPLWMARVEDYVAGRSELTVADLSNRGTFEANYNERALAKILADRKS